MRDRVDIGGLDELARVATFLRRIHGLGIWMYDVSSGEGKWSDEVFDLLGFPRDSKPPNLSVVAGRLSAPEQQEFSNSIRKTVDAGEIFQFDYPLAGSNGIVRCLRACGTLMEDNGRRKVVGSLQDVTQESRALATVEAQATELRALKDQVEAENARFREMFDQAPVFVALGSTPDLRFEYANRAYCELVGDRNLVGKTVSEALPEVVAQGLVDVLQRVSTTGEPHIATAAPTWLVGASEGSNSQVKYLTYIYQPIRDAHDQIDAILCIGYDVTDQCVAEREAEKLRAELFQTSRITAMGTMAATLAHELNQPLTSLVMFAGSLVQRLGKSADDDVVEGLRAIQSETLRASEIMRRMRAVGAGHPIKHQALALDQVIAQALQSPICACEDVEITLDLEHTKFASGDSIQVQQVLGNIVRNACQAMNPQISKRIQIATNDGSNEVLVRVSDNGPGLPPGSDSRIFEGIQSAKVDGMGIGLPICRTIVEAHGGRIGAENNVQGGATFWFTLPRHRD